MWQTLTPSHFLRMAVRVQGDPPTGRFERHQPQVIDPTEGGQVIFTYDVEWEKSTVKWASRWDVYLQMTDDNIHWFSIVNSFVILVFLTGIVALIMLRILRKDFARYNEMALTEEELAEANREVPAPLFIDSLCDSFKNR